MALERFKWPYWQPKLQLLRSNLDGLRSTLLVVLNVIAYQRLLRHVLVHFSNACADTPVAQNLRQSTGSFNPPGVVPRGYDPGEPPRMRRGFRTEPRDTDIESRGPRMQGNWESTGYPSMRVVTKRTRSADIAGSTQGPETVSRQRGRRPMQQVGGHAVESDGDTVPKFPSNEDVLQPPAE